MITDIKIDVTIPHTKWHFHVLARRLQILIRLLGCFPQRLGPAWWEAVTTCRSSAWFPVPSPGCTAPSSGAGRRLGPSWRSLCPPWSCAAAKRTPSETCWGRWSPRRAACRAARRPMLESPRTQSTEYRYGNVLWFVREISLTGSTKSDSVL